MKELAVIQMMKGEDSCQKVLEQDFRTRTVNFVRIGRPNVFSNVTSGPVGEFGEDTIVAAPGADVAVAIVNANGVGIEGSFGSGRISVFEGVGGDVSIGVDIANVLRGDVAEGTGGDIFGLVGGVTAAVATSGEAEGVDGGGTVFVHLEVASVVASYFGSSAALDSIDVTGNIVLGVDTSVGEGGVPNNGELETLRHEVIETFVVLVGVDGETFSGKSKKYLGSCWTICLI